MRTKRIAEYILPKWGNSLEECEDAFQYKSVKNLLKVSLADGATESSFAKEWAYILTENLVKIKVFSIESIISELPKLRSQWWEEVNKAPLPWYAEEKLRKGAFSTFLNLQIEIKKQVYHCMAIGDCCLFQIKNDEMFFSFPILDSKEFSNHPFLLSTQEEDPAELKDHIKEKRNQKIQNGDYLFLMSDALAYWFLMESEKNEKPWNILLGLSEDNSFENWLNIERKEKKIKNDDTTLLIIEAL